MLQRTSIGGRSSLKTLLKEPSRRSIGSSILTGKAEPEACHISSSPVRRKRQQRSEWRHFSDNLLGHSPMAKVAPLTPTTNPDGSAKRIPTAQDVTTSGGIWAPTSAKRDKLAEFKTALSGDHQETLDDVATADQKLDLYLADGLHWIIKTTDSVTDQESPEIQNISEWLVDQQSKLPEYVEEIELSANLTAMAEKVQTLLMYLPGDRYLRDVRDYVEPDVTAAAPEAPGAAPDMDHLSTLELESTSKNFEKAVVRFRLMLTQAAIEHLKTSWELLTTVSDQDIDRAAVQGESLEVRVRTLPLARIYKFLFAHTSGNCTERVDAAWELFDRDDDGRLDEVEMNEVAKFCVAPMQSALITFLEEAVEAYPIRSPLPPLDEASESVEIKLPGWRERRRIKRMKKVLVQTFQKASKNHFENEVEINHRLRCIYAWAIKTDQDNKINSIVIDEDQGWGSKKRHVELTPKISLDEFREVQQEHFTHLDRIGSEILKSFREDLWVLQGQGRERRQLIRDCTAFLAVVSAIDFVILAL